MSRPKLKTVVFYFHSVSWNKNPHWVRNYLTHEIHLFRYLLDWLREENYKVVSLQEAHECNYEFNFKTACLTFDDGYVDFYVFVYPLLVQYKFHATVFVSPLLINPSPDKRRVWNLSDKDAPGYECWGYLNWAEMKEMEDSGFVSVESHTYTHLKYPKSDKIVDFHRPKSNCLYPVGYYHPDKMWNYIGNDEFERLIPFGFPFFEQGSACVTKKKTINPFFVEKVTEELNKNHFYENSAQICLDRVKEIYLDFKLKNSIFLNEETDKEFQSRVLFELTQSKLEIEINLKKKVQFLCWPHGDNSAEVHEIAIQSGYVATTMGNLNKSSDLNKSRIPRRFTIQPWRGSKLLGLYKMRLKIAEYQNNRWVKSMMTLIR
jgi:hypothetical protein